jgi:hypothetical protein
MASAHLQRAKQNPETARTVKEKMSIVYQRRFSDHQWKRWQQIKYKNEVKKKEKGKRKNVSVNVINLMVLWVTVLSTDTVNIRRRRVDREILNTYM